MKILSWLSLAVILLVASSAAAEGEREFSTLQVQIDTSAAELSAWQLRAEFVDPETRIVGIEGGSDAAFAEAPHYDPRALNGGEIILAALSTHQILPAGRITVAVLHVEHASENPPRLKVIDLIAVGPDGNETPATVLQENGEAR
jgi:hypothetical protein